VDFIVYTLMGLPRACLPDWIFHLYCTLGYIIHHFWCFCLNLLTCRESRCDELRGWNKCQWTSRCPMFFLKKRAKILHSLKWNHKWGFWRGFLIANFFVEKPKKIARFLYHIAVGSRQYRKILQVLNFHYLFITKFGLQRFCRWWSP
jgi:hypothetical protein